MEKTQEINEIKPNEKAEKQLIKLAVFEEEDYSRNLNKVTLNY